MEIVGFQRWYWCMGQRAFILVRSGSYFEECRCLGHFLARKCVRRKFSIFINFISNYILFSHILCYIILIFWAGFRRGTRVSVESSSPDTKFSTENVRSEAPFERNFWPFGKRTSLKKVTTKFRSSEASKTVDQAGQHQNRWNAEIGIIWCFWASELRNFVVTFFKLVLFPNGQKFLSKGVSERTFSVLHFVSGEDDSTETLVPLRNPAQKMRIM